MKRCLIIGAGPSGITASIYLKRSGVEPYLVEKSMPGGKVPLTYKIDNYPGFKSINGFDLANEFVNQLNVNNIKIHYEEVKNVKKENDIFQVTTSKGEYEFDAVIIASGTVDSKLNIPGEKEYFAHGVSTCAVCDGNFFKGSPMAIIGGGNSALEESLYLSSLTDKVYLIHRRNEFRGDEEVVSKVKQDPHIEILTPYIPLEIKGDKNVNELVIQNVETKKIKSLSLKAVFTYVGATPNNSFLEGFDIYDEKGYIKVNSEMETSIQGLFACGDCIKKSLRQIATAVGDGANAGISASSYLKR
jgi:thioredoxin reductase (NADPH)